MPEDNRLCKRRTLPCENVTAPSSALRSSLPSTRTPHRSTWLKRLLSFLKIKKKRSSVISTQCVTASQPEVCQGTSVTFRPDECREKRSSTPTLLSPLPPEQLVLPEETDEYDTALESAVQELQTDFTSGARQLADASLRHLVLISDIVARIATTWPEFWAMIVHAAEQISHARPSMSAAITSCLLRALREIAKLWNQEQVQGSQSTSELARITRGVLDEIVKERKELAKQLGTNFTHWLHDHCGEVLSDPLSIDQIVLSDTSKRITAPNTVRILTLSNSSTIRAVVLQVLSSLPDVAIHLTILESRPRCEGADMAAQIYASACDQNRLSISIAPDCAMGTVAKDIDIVLLGADRISSTGNVSNKIGSLATTVCAKQLNQKAKVVVLSDIDKIAAHDQAAGNIETHPSSEISTAWSPATRAELEGKTNIKIFGEWFEWVPARFIDAYVTETGVLDTEDVEKVAKETGDLEEYIFRRSKA